MKLFANFDTNLDQEYRQQYEARYWPGNVLVVYRGKIFKYLHVIMPMVLGLMLIGFFLVLAIYWGWWDYNGVKWFFFVIFAGFIFFYVGFKTLKKRFDYKMDFAVVTPKEIVSMNQTGFFSRSSRTIDCEKIKTVSVSKKWLLRSIFNFGSIVVLTEWDEQNQWDVQLYYIYDPETVRNRIAEIIETDRVQPDYTKGN